MYEYCSSVASPERASNVHRYVVCSINVHRTNSVCVCVVVCVFDRVVVRGICVRPETD